MRRRLLQGMFVLGLTAAVGAGCADDPATPTTPTTTPPSTIETFSGTLTVNGAVTFPFSSSAGSVNTTMTKLTPDTSVIGVSVGLSTGATCQMVLSNDNASINSTVTGIVRDSGTLCARVYDVGKIAAPVTFTINVEHF